MFAEKKRRIESNQQFLKTSVYELVLDSTDRVPGTTCAEPTFAVDPPVTGVVDCEFGWISFYNVFATVTSTTNRLEIVPAAAFPQVDVVFAPAGNWTAVPDLLTRSEFKADPDAGQNDIRYEIFRQVEAVAVNLVSSILVSPVDGSLTIDFNATAVDVTVGPGTTAFDWTGFTAATSGLTWTGTRMQLNRPDAIAISSSDFSNQRVIKSNDTKSLSWMAVVPITAPWGTQNFYEPYSPLTFKFTGSQIMNRVSLRLVDISTGLPVDFQETDRWQLMIRLHISKNF